MAALIYVGFAWQEPSSSPWLAIEFAGVVVYGTFGVLGLKGSWNWLIAGWLLHPLWDLALHHAGPGAHIAPAWYAIACLAFDVIVAADMAFRRGPALARA
ncbi:MAG: hypothetical protein EOP38_05395 [Rubrivivax sp.]|nr:MAG: hypothetical protein EOP38_05395 [Rubrivivax sp.]